MAKKSSTKSNYPKIDRSYEAQDAMRTLVRAQEIQKDKGLMRRVKTEAQKQMKVTASIIKK